MNTKSMIIIASCFFVLVGAVFTFLLSQNDEFAVITQSNETLRNQIKERAKTVYEPAIDARVDRVWKAIPGYNGYALDEQRTLLASKQTWQQKKQLTEVYRQLLPMVQLQDLPHIPIYRGNPRKNMVSFMVNVAWGEEHLTQMLSTLAEHKVKATFFLDGSWLTKHLAIAKEINRQGHELSNHAFSHKNMSELSESSQTAEIVKTERLLQKLGVQNQWFAPPSGDFNGLTVTAARKQGLFTVLWTIDTVDWKKPPASQIVDKVQRLIEPGALILMHPTESSKQALSKLIRIAREKQLRIGTVSETLSSTR
jgi:probable sporulation protein (polysaccharide deacetylase family)